MTLLQEEGVIKSDGDIHFYFKGQLHHGVNSLENQKDFMEDVFSFGNNDQIYRLHRSICHGEELITKSTFSSFLSSISAGLVLGFSAMAIAFALELVQSINALPVKRLAMALTYPFGFIICILSGFSLFTEQTAISSYPLLDHRCNWRKYAKYLLIVLSGNLIGALVSAFIIFLGEPVIQFKNGHIMASQHLAHYNWHEILISAVMAGWLMSIGGWIAMSSSSITGRIISIYIVTFLIGIGGLHHAIAGTIELTIALLMQSQIHPNDLLKFLTAAILGNTIGGGIFVALLNYLQIKNSVSTNGKLRYLKQNTRSELS